MKPNLFKMARKPGHNGGVGMLTYMKALMGEYLNDKRGQGMVEYALLIALIAIVVIAALLLLGPQLANMFNNITNQLK